MIFSKEFPMSDNLPRSIFPPRFQILSGSALKMIAVITMLIDHLGAHIVRHYTWMMHSSIRHVPSIYQMCRDIGRIAMPIYVFLIVEGFLHTRNHFKYGRNLLLFALISEIPWNLIHGNHLRCETQNVYFTLFFGYLGICCIEYFRDRQLLQIAGVLALLYISTKFHADYGWKGYVFVLIMYWFRYEKIAQAVGGSCWLYFEWKACFAFIPINMYNGKRGFIKGNWKYFFYLFYPLHLMILWYFKYYVI